MIWTPLTIIDWYKTIEEIIPFRYLELTELKGLLEMGNALLVPHPFFYQFFLNANGDTILNFDMNV